jgi:hypothetical protein
MSSKIKSGAAWRAAASVRPPQGKRPYLVAVFTQYIFQQLQVGRIIVHDHDVALRQGGIAVRQGDIAWWRDDITLLR